MSQSKRHLAACHLRLIRQELRDIYVELNYKEVCPEPGQIRGLIAQIAPLIDLLENVQRVNLMSLAINQPKSK